MKNILFTTLVASLCMTIAGPVFAQGYNYSLVAASDTVTYKTFSAPALSEIGTVAFRADLNDGTYRILTGAQGYLLTVASAGADQTFSRFASSAPSLGKWGLQVAFSANLNAGGSGVYLWKYAGTPTVTTIADTGDTSPYAAVASPSIGEDSFVGFLGGYKTGGSAIVVGDGMTASVVADTTVAGSLFASLSAPSLNKANDVAFTTRLTNGNTAIYRYHAGALNDAVDTTGVLASLGNPTLNSPYFGAGRLAFTARYDVGGAGAFLFNTATSAVNTVVDTTGAYDNITNISVNSFGKTVFSATLDAGGSGLFTGTDPATGKVIATGDTLFGSTVSSVSVSQDAINDLGEVAFLANLADGRRVIVVAIPR